MRNKEQLIDEIKRAFCTVAFPYHTGLLAARLIDDWCEDEEILQNETARLDIECEWWSLPIDYLLDGLYLGVNYLDARGLVFYLPAYMTAIIKCPECFDFASQARSRSVLSDMKPSDDPELEEYFLQKYSLITGDKKLACYHFLEYVASCLALDEFTREIAKEALMSEFWGKNDHY